MSRRDTIFYFFFTVNFLVYNLKKMFYVGTWLKIFNTLLKNYSFEFLFRYRKNIIISIINNIHNDLIDEEKGGVVSGESPCIYNIYVS